MRLTNKLIVIGIDAAEPSLIEKWIDEGYLQNFAALRKNGSYCKLNSSADWLAGSPWPTFYTGTLPAEHGFYHYLQWKSDKMEYERPNPDWISVVPFWRQLGNQYKVIEVDIPLTFPPSPINGIVISNWASHDRLFPPLSYPKEKINWVTNNFGNLPISDEVGGLQEFNDLMKLKDELILANEKEAELVTSLLKDEDWNLFLCCFSSTHRAGHKFWDTSNVKEKLTDEQTIQFSNCLKEIYLSCDIAIGKILKLVPDDASIIITSLHGMGENTTLSDKILPKMISEVMNPKTQATVNQNTGLIKKVRNLIPLELRSNLRKLLPFWLQDKMTAYWRMAGIVWSKTQVFNMIADLQGYIRINLKGREKEGIVENGEAYNELCLKLIDGLKTFYDVDTNQPVIESILRSDKIYGEGKGMDNLPDILVKWKFKSAANYRRIVSEKFGAIDFPMPGKNLDGRSGNHRAQGFLIAKGKQFQANAALNDKHIIDLAPTILNMLDCPIPQNMKGKVLGTE